MVSGAPPYEPLLDRLVLDLRGRGQEGSPDTRLALRRESSAVAVGVTGVDDHALRCEVVLALLGRVPADPVLGLLTRAGDPGWHVGDAGWDAAMAAALAEAGRPGRLVVLTRSGWSEPRTGTVRRSQPGRRGRGAS